VPIWISGFKRTLSAGNLLVPIKLLVALIQSFNLIRRSRAQVVVGTGGYVAGPVVVVAAAMRLPTVIQEQNSYPGVTTRLLAPFVNEVHLTFESSRRFLRRARNVRVTGNPTRGKVGTISKSDGRRFFGLDENKRTLLVFGGSWGARSLNRAMRMCFKKFVDEGIQVVWQTGMEDHEEIRAEVAGHGPAVSSVVKVYPFIERMENAYGACDLALCRAGATTLAELTKGGVPSILVPFPYAMADHQTENARTMVEAGAAVLVSDDQIGERLFETVKGLIFDDRTLGLMSISARSLGRPEAAETIASSIIALAERSDVGRRARL
jgi:UDP-N-acetylglucosamine--N-acetylmuramyl-(pentapeptide) pyrophosphoryl-undecaprenol N-acetylglucosamine transferase